MARRPAMPVDMRRVYGRFERWRKLHTGRLPIPRRLWTAAAELAKEHGVCQTAQVLHLEYRKLKQMAESASPVPRSKAVRKARTSFVELVAPPPVGGAECLIELEGPRGKMRIQWKGATTPDLAGLSRVLWESA
jgi:hypothetical protein